MSFAEGINAATSGVEFSGEESQAYNLTTVLMPVVTGFSLYRPWYPIKVSIDIIVMIASIPLNALTVIAYIKFPELRNPTNFLICTQSAGDLFTTFTAPYALMLGYTRFGLNTIGKMKYPCLCGLSISLMALLNSFINMLVLSVERFIAVYFPFKYFIWVTDQSVKIVIAVVCSIVFIINILPLFGWNEWKQSMNCFTSLVYSKIFFQYLFLIPCVIILLMTALVNIAISVLALRKRNSITPMENSAEGGNSKSTTPFRQTTQYKVTKMLLMVVGFFYLSLLPYLVINTLYFAQPKSWKLYGLPKWFPLASDFTKSLLLLNALANSVIYAFQNRQFRNAYFKILGITRDATNTDLAPSVISHHT